LTVFAEAIPAGNAITIEIPIFAGKMGARVFPIYAEWCAPKGRRDPYHFEKIATKQYGGLWASFNYGRNEELPAQKTGGRYKGNPHNGGMVL
jgi:hypothetical protein